MTDTVKGHDETAEPIAVIDFDDQVLVSVTGQIEKWFQTQFMSIDTILQLGLILAAFAAGLVLSRLAAPYLSRGIERLPLPLGLRNALLNLRRLVPLAFTVLVLFVAIQIHRTMGLSMNVTLVDAARHLGTAWIIIRMAVQIVKSPAMRFFVTALVWVITVLNLCGYLDETAQILDSMSITLGKVHLSALTMTKAVIVTIILMYAASVASRIVEHRLANISNMAPGSRLLISKIVRILLMIVAILIGISLAGINLGMLAVFSGAVGLGVGLGLQRGVSNLFTGMMLLMDKTIQPGDLIELPDGTLGVVHNMASRCTELRALDNRTFLVPNEQLVSNQVINWSRGRHHVAQSVSFSVHSKHDPRDVMKIAIDAVRGLPRVQGEPGCSLTSFDDNNLHFSLGYRINDPQSGTGNLKGDVNLALWDAFKAHGISFPDPKQKIIVTMAPEPEQ